jgi:hypothetical protein
MTVIGNKMVMRMTGNDYEDYERIKYKGL